MHTTVYIMYRTPIIATHHEEKLTSIKSNLSHLKAFGCIGYAHIPDELRTKLDPILSACSNVGFLEGRLYFQSIRDK